MIELAPIAVVRTRARALHATIDDAIRKEGAAMRVDFERAKLEATSLGASLQSLADDRRATVREHLNDAALHLRSAAVHAQIVLDLKSSDVRSDSRSVLAAVRATLHDISDAVAAERAHHKEIV